MSTKKNAALGGLRRQQSSFNVSKTKKAVALFGATAVVFGL
jgi:hypothetical protein